MPDRPVRAHGWVNPKLFGAAGAAGLAAVFTSVPMAGAATPTTTSSTAPQHAGTDASSATSAHPKPHVSAKVAPDYGYQKFRVGVQVKDGSWVPDGTTTAGSTVKIIETGPGLTPAVKRAHDTSTKESTCVTQADTLVDGSTETYCTFPDNSDIGPGAGDYYYAAPGDTVTLQETTAEPNLVIDPVKQTVDPATSECTGIFCAAIVGPITFNDPGLPPVAVDDSATTDLNTPVSIDVESNDDPKGAPATIATTDSPTHGTVAVTGAQPGARPGVAGRRAPASGQKITYTPDTGFFGTDVFHYRLTTANGSSVAKVTVTVKAPPPTAVDDSASTKPGVPVTIHLTANDKSNGGGAITVTTVGDPDHGRTRQSGSDAVYTPGSTFTGVAHFRYSISTAGGTASANVTVTVTAPDATATTSPAPTPTPTPTPSPTRSDEPLAVTGVPTATLGEVGIGLVALGALATAVGRRRRRDGNHA